MSLSTNEKRGLVGLLYRSRVTIGRLRREHPQWRWRAVRTGGFGWEYEGRKGERRVTIKAYSVLSGPNEDDYATQWMAEEKGSSRSFAQFSLVERGAA